jgi:protein gp37
VFVARHRCVVVEVFNVKGEKLGAGGGYDAIEEAFAGSESGGVCRGDPRVVKLVTVDCEANEVALFFVRADGGNDAATWRLRAALTFGGRRGSRRAELWFRVAREGCNCS